MAPTPGVFWEGGKVAYPRATDYAPARMSFYHHKLNRPDFCDAQQLQSSSYSLSGAWRHRLRREAARTRREERAEGAPRMSLAKSGFSEPFAGPLQGCSGLARLSSAAATFLPWMAEASTFRPLFLSFVLGPRAPCGAYRPTLTRHLSPPGMRARCLLTAFVGWLMFPTIWIPPCSPRLGPAPRHSLGWLRV